MSDRFWDNYPGPTLLHYIKSFFQSNHPTLITSSIKQQQYITNNIYTINHNTYTYNEYKYTSGLPDDIKQEIMTAFNLYKIEVPCNTILLTLRNMDGHLVGTIAAKPYGRIRRNYLEAPSSFNLHYIDFFWTALKYRRAGIGNFLLNAIFRCLNYHYGAAPVLFIKEGEALKKVIPPLYSSYYICTAGTGVQGRGAQFVSQETAQRIAAKWIGSSTGTLQQCASQQKNMKYVLCDKAVYYITIPSQTGPDGNPIVWITGAVFSPLIKNYTTTLNTCAAFLKQHYSGYIWADIKYLNNESFPLQWKIDGPFHVYAFQWDPGAFPMQINGGWP